MDYVGNIVSRLQHVGTYTSNMASRWPKMDSYGSNIVSNSAIKARQTLNMGSANMGQILIELVAMRVSKWNSHWRFVLLPFVSKQTEMVLF